jgi:pimeloyl-ACP methyl ester carboxylesterase
VAKARRRAAARPPDGRFAVGGGDRRPGLQSPLHRTDAANGRASPPDARRRRSVPRGLARLVSELLDRLDLTGVTIVGNDTAGALVQLLASDCPPRVGGIVLVSCDAFDNFPPGLTGKTLVFTGRLPPALFGLFMQQMRFRSLRRLPLAFGWLTMRGDAATARWIEPVLNQREIRRDTVRVLRTLAAERSCSTRPTPCRASSAPHSLSGQAKTASCPRARPPSRRAPAARTAGRDTGQLHADPARPAGATCRGHSAVHARRTYPGRVCGERRLRVRRARVISGLRRADASGTRRPTRSPAGGSASAWRSSKAEAVALLSRQSLLRSMHDLPLDMRVSWLVRGRYRPGGFGAGTRRATC